MSSMWNVNALNRNENGRKDCSMFYFEKPDSFIQIFKFFKFLTVEERRTHVPLAFDVIDTCRRFC